MTVARRHQIALDETPYYHCISRCVRRAFLCGYDRATGRDYDHRRDWIRSRLAQLVGVFAVDLCAYAIMPNHYHVVLRADVKQATEWSEREVIARWCRLFKGPETARRYLAGDPLDEAEQRRLSRLAGVWRERLSSISWFMRSLNEPIARHANNEDECKGRFWEGRFTSQALLDEKAVLACMAYVDLNPVRAGLADTPEESDFTSVQQRAQAIAASGTMLESDRDHHELPALAPLEETLRSDDNGDQSICRMQLHDYLELVDQTGRALREDKPGAIPEGALPMLTRLGIDQQAWLRQMQPRLTYWSRALGAAERIRQYARAIGQKWLWGVHACRGVSEAA